MKGYPYHFPQKNGIRGYEYVPKVLGCSREVKKINRLKLGEDFKQVSIGISVINLNFPFLPLILAKFVDCIESVLDVAASFFCFFRGRDVALEALMVITFCAEGAGGLFSFFSFKRKEARSEVMVEQ